MVSYCIILKIAVISKDLYGNSGNRFKKILVGIFNKNAWPYLLRAFLLNSASDCEKANTAPMKESLI